MTTTTTSTPTPPAPTTENRRNYWKGHATKNEISHWRKIATTVSQQLASDVVKRDSSNLDPRTEIQLLRDSGLLTLPIPAEFGGGGAHWETAFTVVREIARVDSSIAHILAYNYLNQSVIGFAAPLDEQAKWYQQIIEKESFWGDAVNPVDPDLTLTPVENGYRLNGFKRFATGASASDVVLVTADITAGENKGKIFFVALDHDRDGITFSGDWDALGQRLTASGSVEFKDVVVRQDDLVAEFTEDAYLSLFTPAIQLVFGNIFLGIAEGALNKGKEITRSRQNSWFLSTVEKYRDDPFIQRTYGELVARTAAVAALTELNNWEFDEIVDHPDKVDEAARGAIAIEIAKLKIVASEVAVDIANRIYETTGSSSTGSSIGLDLFWRNIRTLSLHDPVDYKKLEVGANFLNGTLQPLSLYT